MSARPSFPVFRFGRHDRMTIGGVQFSWLRKEGDRHLLARVDDPLRIELFDDAALNAAMRDDPTWRLDVGRDDPARRLAVARTGVADLWTLPPAHQETIHFRAEWCQRFIAMEATGAARRSDESMKKAIRTIFGEMCGDAISGRGERKKAACGKVSTLQPPTPRTLRSWLNRFETGGSAPGALVDCRVTCSGNRGDRFDPAIQALVEEHALTFATEERPTKKICYAGLRAAVKALNGRRVADGLEALPLPSATSFNRRIRALDPFFVKAGRYGKKAASEHFRICHEGVDVTRPLQRVEMDCWKVHLQTLLIKARLWHRIPENDREKFNVRLTLCVAEDCASRAILGMTLSRTSTTEAALETLAMVTRDKGAFATEVGALSPWDMRGSPTCVVTDRGSEFTSSDFRTAVAALKADLIFPPAGTPTMRGRIERLFATFGAQLLPYFPGRTFSNPVDAGDYPSMERACITPDQLARVLVRYVVDVYHNAEHRGLRGETPRQAWLRLTHVYGVVPPPDRHIRRVVFGRKLRRVIGPHGIQVAGLYYQHPDLHAKVRLRRADPTVDVRVDVNDLGLIAVRIDGEWRVASCRQEGMHDVTLAEWQTIVASIKASFSEGEEVRRDVIDAALAEIRAVAESAKSTILAPEAINAEEIDVLEANLFANLPRIDWDDPKRTPVIQGDPFDQAVPTSTLQEGEPDEAEPPVDYADPRSDDDVDMED